MFIREYVKSDNKEIFNLFYNSVHSISNEIYSEDQLFAWAKKNANIDKWCKKFEDSYSLVAIEDDRIVGFANVDQNGYIESVYVDKKYQNKKIGTKLINEMQNYIKKKNKNELSAYSSKNAEVFFEKLGFNTESLNILLKDSLELEIFYMKKAI